MDPKLPRALPLSLLHLPTVEDFRLVQQLVMEAEDSLILGEGRGCTRRRHSRGEVMEISRWETVRGKDDGS